MQTTASYLPLLAMPLATSGSSKLPGTQATCTVAKLLISLTYLSGSLALTLCSKSSQRMPTYVHIVVADAMPPEGFYGSFKHGLGD